MNVAETENLILREYTVMDAEDFFRIHSDAETMRFQNGGPETVDDERGAIKRHIENYYHVYGYRLWALILKESGRLIGRCGLVWQEFDGERHLEMSYLLDREYWDRGFATEAARATVALAKERFGIKKLIAIIAQENIGSIRVAEKAGFSLERRIDRY